MSDLALDLIDEMAKIGLNVREQNQRNADSS
jgi:hypothetical protein